MDAVLEKVEWHTKRLQTQLVREPKFSKSEKVFVQIFGKVATDELFAAIVERTCAICTCMIAQCRSLGKVSMARIVLRSI